MEEFRTPRPPRSRVDGRLSSQTWTASRCHRLLRPLFSRISSLRKSVLALSNVVANTDAELDQSRQKRPAVDGDWLQSRKKVRRTYARKTVAVTSSKMALPDETAVKFRSARELQQSESVVDGELAVPTPWLRRARGQTLSSPAQSRERSCASKCSGGDRQSRKRLPGSVEQRLQFLRNRLRPAQCNDYDGIFRSLEALLRATRPREDRQKSGPRSLLNMCLSTMPKYIAEIEAWDSLEAEKCQGRSMIASPNASFQMYGELEKLGLGHGWQHLRTLVRASAIDAITNAMKEGLMDDEFITILLDLCAQNEALAESDELLRAFANRQYPRASGVDASFSENAILLPLSYLRDGHQTIDRSSRALSHITRLTSNALLPADWLVTTEFEPFWSMAYQNLSRGHALRESSHFIVSSLHALCKVPISTTQLAIQRQGYKANTFQLMLNSAVAIITSMGILGQEALLNGQMSARTDTFRIRSIGGAIQYTLQACSIENKLRRRGRRSPGEDLINLAYFFTTGEIENERCAANILGSVRFVEGGGETASEIAQSRSGCLHNAMISTITSIAGFCKRGGMKTAQGYIDRLCQSLAGLGMSDADVKRVSRAIAFSLAQRTSDVRDMIFAERLASDETSVADRGQVMKRRQSLFMGYQWEDTIGEWVEASPNARRTSRINRRSLASLRAADNDEWSVASSSEDTEDISAPMSGCCFESDLETESEEESDFDADTTQSPSDQTPDTSVDDSALRCDESLDDSGPADSSVCIRDMFEQHADDDELSLDTGSIPPSFSSSTAGPQCKRVMVRVCRRVRLSGGFESDDELGN